MNYIVGPLLALGSLSVGDVQPPPRVLLITSGPTREYQFFRSFLVAEQDKKRVELTICEQWSSVARQDVLAEGRLADFPERLNGFDLIIAFDPDWNRLAPERRMELERWLKAGGGLVLVGGPLFTRQLVVEKLAPIRDTGNAPPEIIKKVEKLIADLDSNEFEVRQRAEEELAKQGRVAIQVLEKALGEKPPLEVSKRVERILDQLRQSEVKARIVYIGSNEMWRWRLNQVECYERFWRGVVKTPTGTE